MRRSAMLSMLLAAGLMLPVSGAMAQTPTNPARPASPAAATEELVVDFGDAVPASAVSAVAARLGIALRPNSAAMVESDRMYVATVPRAREGEILRALRSDGNVEAAEENVEYRALFTPNDPLFERQWGLRRLGSEEAWNITCGEGVTVAVVDTGVACENHGEFTRIPDLAGARCLRGWNFVDGTDHANDDQGHGTHVAGTIAQTTNNAFGAAGVAHCARILPVKVLDSRGSGSLANVAEGIRWAADHGAQVINLSLGGGSRSNVMAAAVAYARSKGATVVCAAGNNGRYVESPANSPGAIAVSAIDEADQIAYFSSRGPEVDVAAPGVQILQQTICNNGRDRCEQFAAFSGTSMAAPHVAGVAALLYSLGVSDPDAVEAALKRHATRTSHGNNEAELYGAGIVSAAEVTRGEVERQGTARLIALVLLALGLGWYVRGKKGELGSAWVLPAFFTGVGLFFAHRWVPHFFFGAELLMRPVAAWDTVLLGAAWHRWLVFANLGTVMLLVGMGFGKKALRGPIGGVALGVAAFLLADWWTGALPSPVGKLLSTAWVALNVAACLWVARIGIDRKTAE